MWFGSRWRRALPLVCFVFVIGCRGEKPRAPVAPPPPPPPPASAPASQLAASAPAPAPPPAPPVSAPIVKQRAELRELQAKLQARADAVAKGEADIATVWREVPSHLEALRKAVGGKGPKKMNLAPALALVRERFDFLVACRAVKANDPAACDQAAPLGPQSVAWCKGQLFFVRTFLPQIFQEKKCEPPTLARVAGTLRLDRAQTEGFCGAIAERTTARCPAQPAGLRPLCLALASRDASMCGPPPKDTEGGPGKERYCPELVAAMRALENKDASLLPAENDMGTYVGLLLAAPVSCEDRFRASFQHDVGSQYQIK
ncbi:MAG TPA: hypothetical protein VGQ83_36750 [Polyangia bacterium]|jgi:hypothetical protein